MYEMSRLGAVSDLDCAPFFNKLFDLPLHNLMLNGVSLLILLDVGIERAGNINISGI